MERARFYSVFGVFVVAGGLLIFLFQDSEAVTIALEGPEGVENGVGTFVATITIPAGQRLPVAGQTVVIENARSQPPDLLESATCWGDVSCEGGLRYFRNGFLVRDIVRLDSESPSMGPLQVRVEGYGRSSTTGYGQEVRADRSLVADDLVDPEAGAAYGPGYGADRPVTLRYAVSVDASQLEGREFDITFLVETGSRAMGQVSGPRLTASLP